MRHGYQMRARVPAAHTSAIARAQRRTLQYWQLHIRWSGRAARTLSARTSQSATSRLVFSCSQCGWFLCPPEYSRWGRARSGRGPGRWAYHTVVRAWLGNEAHSLCAVQVLSASAICARSTERMRTERESVVQKVSALDCILRARCLRVAARRSTFRREASVSTCLFQYLSTYLCSDDIRIGATVDGHWTQGAGPVACPSASHRPSTTHFDCLDPPCRFVHAIHRLARERRSSRTSVSGIRSLLVFPLYACMRNRQCLLVLCIYVIVCAWPVHS